MNQQSQSPHRFSLAIYLLLANGLTWLGWIPGLVIGLRKNYIMPNFDTYHILFDTGFANQEHIMLAFGFFMGVYGPLVAGLVATWMDGGKTGVAEWWGRVMKWNIGGRWYLLAFLFTLSFAALPTLGFGLIGGFVPNQFPALYILGLFFAQLLRSGLGEEPGWRGFLLPRLKAKLAGDRYVWVLGLIWSAWHWPLVIAQIVGNVTDVTLPQLIITVIMSLAGNVMALIGITHIYVWLYNKTESVFLAIFFHALSNMFSFWLTSFLETPQSAMLAVALMPWAVVLLMEKRLGKENFPG